MVSSACEAKHQNSPREVLGKALWWRVSRNTVRLTCLVSPQCLSLCASSPRSTWCQVWGRAAQKRVWKQHTQVRRARRPQPEGFHSERPGTNAPEGARLTLTGGQMLAGRHVAEPPALPFLCPSFRESAAQGFIRSRGYSSVKFNRFTWLWALTINIQILCLF